MVGREAVMDGAGIHDAAGRQRIASCATTTAAAAGFLKMRFGHSFPQK